MTTHVSTEMSVGAVFDRVHQMLGIGDRDTEDDYGWRVRQIGMLKRLMTRRGLTGDDVLMCAEYCKAHRIQPESYPWLLATYDSAFRWSKTRAVTPVETSLEEAIAYEHALSDERSTSWIERLVRTSPQNAEEVLAEWRSARHP